MGLLGVILSPLMVLFGNYIPYRIGMAEARSDEERYYIRLYFRKVLGWSLGLSVAIFTATWLAFRNQYAGPIRPQTVFMAWFTCFVVLYLLCMFAFAITGLRHRRNFYARELATEHGGVIPKPAWEYCSRAKFLGLPLIHIRVGDRFDFMRKPVVGWIVCANYAIGGLVAFGGVAVAPFSIGALAIGLIPFGGICAGIFPLGGLAIGGWAYGGITIGWQAIGGIAIAWNQATGGLALAHDFAVGDIAHALSANTDAARQLAQSNSYFQAAQVVSRHWFWTNLLWITPLFIQWRLIARSRRLEQKNGLKPDALKT
jgi:hypothetical protein